MNGIISGIKIFEKKEKNDFLVNCILSFIVAVNEVFGVGAVVFFIGYSSDAKKIADSQFFTILNNLNLEITPIEFIVIFGILLIIYYLFRCALNIYFGHRLTKFSEEMYASIAKRLLHKYLKMEYSDFIKRGPTFIQKVLVSETYNFTHVISAGLMLATESAMLLMLCTFLFYADFYATISIILFLFISLVFTKISITKKMINLGVVRELSQKKYYDSISNIFRNFKYIKIDNFNAFFEKEFQENVGKYAGANVKAATLSLIPRSVLEFLGYLVIILLFIYVWLGSSGSITETLPVLAMFALGLMRMLPSLNRVITNYNQIHFHKNTFNIICNELQITSQPQNKPALKYDTSIEIDNLEVLTADGQTLLRNSSFLINKNIRIGIIGSSGVGKSTFVDVLLGLHQASKYSIRVDGCFIDSMLNLNLKSIVSFIPQKVYLFSGSVGQNIAMSLEYDPEKALDIINKLELDNALQSRQGLETQVGEDGMMLSGGQLQRVGIARALYQDSEIIILDEPTSSVDSVTAIKIMEKLYEIAKNKTLIIISHQLDVLEKCQVIYEIKDQSLHLIKNE